MDQAAAISAIAPAGIRRNLWAFLVTAFFLLPGASACAVNEL